MPLDLGRVLADEVALVVLDRGRDDFALVGKGAFAEAGDSLVGVELDEDEVLVVAGVDEEGAEVGYAEVEGFGVFEGAFEGAGLLLLRLLRAERTGGGAGGEAEGGQEGVAAVEGGHARCLRVSVRLPVSVRRPSGRLPPQAARDTRRP